MDVPQELGYITEDEVRCDLRKVTRLLNALVDNTNWLIKMYAELRDTSNDLEQRVLCLEERVDNLDERVSVLEACCEEVQEWIQKFNLDTINQAINMVNGRVDTLYSWLPIPYGLIDGKGWKFAMGNISVMSDNNSTPSINGAGIFTAGQIEDNDLYFN